MTKQTPKATPVKAHKKCHYPAVCISATALKYARSSKNNKKEDFGLVQMLEFICAAEEKSITEFLKLNSNSIPSKDVIEDVLTKLLRKIPQHVQSLTGSSVKFEPELPKNERTSVLAKRRKLQELQELSERLHLLEENPDALREATGLWLGKVPELSSTVAKSDQVNNISGMFKSALDSMNSECDQILKFANDCQHEVSRAKEMQERLYDSYNSVRIHSLSFINPMLICF